MILSQIICVVIACEQSGTEGLYPDFAGGAQPGARLGRVEGKIALITGGASGIGRASASLLADEGACVVVADQDVSRGKSVADAIGRDARFVELDVTSEERWREAIDEVVADLGRLDVLVNCAGIGTHGNLEEYDLDEWHRTLAVNLDGVLLGCKYALRAMRHSGGGSIVNISSIAGLIGFDDLAAYGASKAGVRQLTRTAALHACRQRLNVRCNAILPTFVDTPMLDALGEELGSREAVVADMITKIPLGRMAQPEDIAFGVLFLASDESAMVTGSDLVIDGGTSVGIAATFEPD